MTNTEIRNTLNSADYSFLRENPHLGNNVILITVGGSHAYGTETPTSDLDIRGCARCWGNPSQYEGREIHAEIS